MFQRWPNYTTFLRFICVVRKRKYGLIFLQWRSLAYGHRYSGGEIVLLLLDILDTLGQLSNRILSVAKNLNLWYMSPVSPVFHTIETARIVLKFKRNSSSSPEIKISMLEHWALKFFFFIPTSQVNKSLTLTR